MKNVANEGVLDPYKPKLKDLYRSLIKLLPETKHPDETLMFERKMIKRNKPLNINLFFDDVIAREVKSKNTTRQEIEALLSDQLVERINEIANLRLTFKEVMDMKAELAKINERLKAKIGILRVTGHDHLPRDMFFIKPSVVCDLHIKILSQYLSSDIPIVFGYLATGEKTVRSNHGSSTTLIYELYTPIEYLLEEYKNVKTSLGFDYGAESHDTCLSILALKIAISRMYEKHVCKYYAMNITRLNQAPTIFILPTILSVMILLLMIHINISSESINLPIILMILVVSWLIIHSTIIFIKSRTEFKLSELMESTISEMKINPIQLECMND